MSQCCVEMDGLQKLDERYLGLRRKAFETSGQSGSVKDFMKRGASDDKRVLMTTGQVDLWLRLANLYPSAEELGLIRLLRL